MAHIYLSIGSNINRSHSIRSAMKQLEKDFYPVVFSSIYETKAVGFKGNLFYNLVAYLETDLSYFEAVNHFKLIENKLGRKRSDTPFSSRTLDIDILLYDDLILQPDYDLPRKEITHYHFVLFPLAEIAPNLIHPELQQTISEIARHSSLNPNELVKITL